MKKVYKTNFELLPELVEIILSENVIETINSDTFEGLRKLEIIVLCELLLWKLNSGDMLSIAARNRIKKLNGQTFERLPVLHHVDLIANECINKKFIGRKKIQNSLLIISDKCGFDDSEIGKVFSSFKKSLSRFLLKPFTV